MDLIYSEEEIRMFFEKILPERWEDHETAFISIAARKKYLPDNVMTDLGRRPQMLDRNIIKEQDFLTYLAGLYRFTSRNGYLDNNMRPIPDEAKVFYANIHLSDPIAAYEEIKEKMAGIDREIISHAAMGHNDISHAIGSIKNMAGLWYTAIQNTCSRKLWIDYDIDLIDPGIREHAAKRMLAEIDSFAEVIIKKHTVLTRGGFHILMASAKNGTAFSKDFNPELLLKHLEDKFGNESKEIVVNHNGMIPLPGTMQGGFPVRFLK